MNAMIECPKCKGRMEEGFLLDQTYGAYLASKWVKGTPEKNFWLGGVKIKNKEQRAISTFRCASCGYLEFYAK